MGEAHNILVLVELLSNKKSGECVLMRRHTAVFVRRVQSMRGSRIFCKRGSNFDKFFFFFFLGGGGG